MNFSSIFMHFRQFHTPFGGMGHSGSQPLIQLVMAVHEGTNVADHARPTDSRSMAVHEGKSKMDHSRPTYTN